MTESESIPIALFPEPPRERRTFTLAQRLRILLAIFLAALPVVVGVCWWAGTH